MAGGSGIGETYQTIKQMDKAAPTPAGGYFRLYSKSDGFYMIGSDGVEIKINLANENIASFIISQSITNGVTNLAPSGDAIFDALALKAPLESPTFTGTVNASTVTSNGINTNAGQPAFSAKPTADILNVTGAGAKYFVVFDNEFFDQNNNHNSGVFTAPVTGKYKFNVGLYFVTPTAGMRAMPFFDTPTYPYYFADVQLMSVAGGGSGYMASGSLFVHLAKGNTVSIAAYVTGGAADSLDIANQSYFSGYLVC